MNISADRIITVGSLKITLPAFINTITALLVGIFLVFKGQAMLGLIIMLTMLVNSYSINCMVVGHCNTWALVLTAVAAVSILSGKIPMKK